MSREHNTNLDEYENAIHRENSWSAQKIGNHYYYVLPLGTSLLVMPIVRLIDIFEKKVLYYDINQPVEGNYGGGIELFIASLIVALTSVFIFLIAFQISQHRYQSFIALFIFAFCTSAWSTASRALWSHTPTILMLSIALYSILRAKQNERWLFIAALAIAYSYVVRPTNSLAIIFFSLYVAITYPKRIPLFLSGLALILFPFVIYNLSVYHQILSPYYLPSTLKVGRSPYLMEALAGTLFSPGRGLFIFSSVFIFSIAGIIIRLFQKKFTLLDATILIVMLLHYYVISSIATPYGGWSFGPRYFTDIVPFFIYFIIYFIQYLFEMKRGVLKISFLFLFLITTSLSFFIHYKGATHPETFFDWNAVGNVEEHHERVWSWNDLQFLR